jgi:hypothetical protein
MAGIMLKVMMALLVLAFVGLLIFIPFSIKHDNELFAACKEAGGIPYLPYRSSVICFNPSAIMELK